MFDHVYKDIPDMLSEEQEQEIIERLKTVDKETEKRLRDELVTRNIRYAISCSISYRDMCPDRDGLTSAAIDGLMLAGVKFDPHKGAKFITCAVWHIRNALNEFVRKFKPVVYPPNIQEDHRKINRLVNMGRDWEGAALELGKTEYALRMAQSYHEMPVSLDNEPDDGFSVRETICCDAPLPDEVCESHEYQTLVDDIFSLTSDINKRDMDIFHRVFGLCDREPETLEKIGKRYGLSRERVRQIKEKVLAKIRQRANGRLAKVYGEMVN